MRVAIIADIHGNFRALQAVLADIDRLGVDDIVSLGDNVGYGPEPDEVIKTLISRRIFSIMGNHELALSSENYYNRLNFTTRMSLDLTRKLMSEESLTWVKTLPSHALRHGARFVHGSPPQSISQYLYDPSENRLRRLLSLFPEQLCFFGHTHNLVMFRWESMSDNINQLDLMIDHYELPGQNRYIINPGSVGQPRDGINRKAKYAIWSQGDNALQVRAVNYDVQATVRLLRERHFPSFNAERLES
jgi:predicted phosphodiesterase